MVTDSREYQRQVVDVVMEVANELRQKLGEPIISDVDARRPEYSRQGHATLDPD